MKKSIKAALGKSITAEEGAVKNRFDRADEIMEKMPKNVQKPTSTKPIVRDSFTIPDFDYALFSQIQARLLKRGKVVNKSELVRAGLQALWAMTDADLDARLENIIKVKVGRPSMK